MSKQFTLGKQERVKSRKLIEQLFSEGQRFAAYPFRVFYLLKEKPATSRGTALQCGAGASRKNFKKAVDRNRIKRLTREAYRLQKTTLENKLKNNKQELAIFLIYTSKELPEFTILKEKLAVILNKLITIADEIYSSNS